MPIIHSQVGAQVKTQNGKTALVPPQIALNLRGPVLQASVSIEPNAGKALLAQGKDLPRPISGTVLIDTGASGTCIDDDIAKKLGLPVVDTGKMISATHKDQECNMYPIQISMPGINLNCPKAMGAALAAQGLVALIGRDILAQCCLFYNGPTGQFTLTM